ncbi:hypothetical protein RB614_10355 [Phytohabitans sp. ZYX-F-186]|uniref:Glycosyltransferase RgtA/B/C/D-like domain-containing protein n=1 Tax=Phytohabitans maris TaxID=3071409 RepID=A0ABU0ZEZ5_9ACTN|nr:hypothetical protein [Phytohabitans sp. ZYX-F-186]MDQ7904922.1 hypothetical protein [Phytohabitans sp. ZYX-F-186]
MPPAEERPGWPARARAALLPYGFDAGAAVLAVALLCSLHDIRAIVHLHYWLDEAWVALSVRLPLSDLPVATSSTPLGWTVLLRLVPGVDRLRLLPLAFLAAAVLIAYALGRSLGWRSRAEGILAGLAAATGVILLPASQMRHDLKQYTADAAVALALVTLVSLTERHWSRRRLAAIAALSAAGMLISHPTAIMAVCAAGGLAVTALARRQWRRLVESLVTGAVAGAAVLAVYLGVTTRGRNESLQSYWAGYFPDFDNLGEYVDVRMSELQRFLGMPWGVLLALALVGVLVVAQAGRPATAVAVGLVPVVMVALGLAEAYPLLDLRTSHFFLVLVAAMAGLAVAGVALAAARGLTRVAGSAGGGGERVRPRPWSVALAAVVVAATFTIFANANRDFLRLDDPDKITPNPSTASGDVRRGVRYLKVHRQPGDVIVVNALGSFGFALYWQPDRPILVRNPRLAVGWTPEYPEESRIVVAQARTDEATLAALADARRLAAAPGATGRIWLVRTHIVPAEKQMWRNALTPWVVEPYPQAGDQGLVAVIRPKAPTE